jgi:hypothetical protein
MPAEQTRLLDVTDATRQILLLINRSPPHVRPWLRGIEAEAEHIAAEVKSAEDRASRLFLSWLMAGIEQSEERSDG